MAIKSQMTGMLGVYLTAVELTRRNLIVSPTSRSAAGADLLVIDQQCARAWSVQVKTNSARAGFWLVGAKAKEISSPSHIYVLVNGAAGDIPEFYVLPSDHMAAAVKQTQSSTGTVWFEYWLEAAYRDNWILFE